MLASRHQMTKGLISAPEACSVASENPGAERLVRRFPGALGPWAEGLKQGTWPVGLVPVFAQHLVPLASNTAKNGCSAAEGGAIRYFLQERKCQCMQHT